MDRQPSQPTYFQTGTRYKVHHSYIWLGPLTAITAVIVIVVLNSLSSLIQLAHHMHGQGTTFSLWGVVVVLLGIIVIFAVIFLIYYLSYRNISYVFDEGEFSFYSGIITKRQVHLPYARVQSVNHRAGLIQRLAGVCTVTIDSAGGASNKAIRIPYVKLNDAEAIRTELFTRKMYQQQQPAPAANTATGTAAYAPQLNVLDSTLGNATEWRGVYAGATPGLEAPSFEFGLTNKEVFLTCLSHEAPIGVALGIGIPMAFFIVTSLVVWGTVNPIATLLAVLAIVAVVVVSYALGMAGTALSLGGFRARRRGSRIEVERGLLQRIYSGIDISRVQSIHIKQTFIKRLLGYCEISVGRINTMEAQTSNDKKANDSPRGLVIHPFVKLEYAQAIINGLAPEFADCPVEQQLMPLHKKALRRAIIRRCLIRNIGLYLLACAVVFAIVIFAVSTTNPGLDAHDRSELSSLVLAILIVAVVIFVLFAVARGISAVLWARNSGFVWNLRYAVFYNAGLSTNLVITPRNKIQGGYAKSNPFQRHAKVATIYALMARGVYSAKSNMVDVPQEAAEAWTNWLKPRVRQ